MAQAATLSRDEVALLRAYRKLKQTGREFRQEALGLARTPKMLLELRNTEFLRVPIESVPTLSEAIE